MTQQKAPKWLINFTRKDLVVASWGSSKGADLLYHLIYKASREVENKGFPETLKDVKFQEPQHKMRELATVSVGSLHTYLRYFVSVGYVTNRPYSKEFEVHLEAIEKAFSETPAKPEVEQTEKPARKPRTKKVSEIETMKLVTLPLEELDKLYNKMFQLNDLFQSLNEKYSDLNEKYTKLNTLKSPESAQNTDVEAISDPLYDSVCFRDDSEFFSAPESEHEQPAQTSTEEKKVDETHSQEGTEQLSYSQDTSTIRESGDENESHSQFGGCMAKLIAEFEANLAPYETRLFVVSSDTWLQENTETHVDTQPPSQEISVQTNIFGEALPEKPTVPASSRPPILVSTRPDVPEIRQKTAAQIAKERKEIERHIWKLLDDAAEARIGRAFTKPMEDLVTGIMDGAYVDEDFTFSVQDLKARGQGLTFSNIVNNMADAVIKRKAGQQPGKIIPFQQNQQQHKGSPTGYVMTSQQEQQVKDNLEPEMERRRARIAARKAQEAAMA